MQSIQKAYRCSALLWSKEKFGEKLALNIKIDNKSLRHYYNWPMSAHVLQAYSTSSVPIV